MSNPINLEEWTRKLVGKKVIEIGGTVRDPTREVSNTHFILKLVGLTKNNLCFLQVSESEIAGGVPKYRIVTPGMMMTMDYCEDRLNVHVDQGMIVQKVTIG